MHIRSSRTMRSNTRREDLGFTLVEVVIAGAMIAIFVIGAVVAMTQMNRFASASRLRTLALAAAQQRIDEVLTTAWQINARPPVLAAGSRTEIDLPLNNDAFNSQNGLSSAFTALDLQVSATRVTEVRDLLPRRVRAVVSVSYTYRGRPYSVSLTTIRATDNI
jgi:type II secretory pathway pseudopilin PulG